MKKISLATLYNTVHAFKKAGHLKEILINNHKSYFDTNTKPHHHFFSENENELTDIPVEAVHLDKSPEAPKGKQISQVEVIIRLENDNQIQKN